MILSVLLGAGASRGAVVTTFEAAGLQNTTAVAASGYNTSVENFNGRSLGGINTFNYTFDDGPSNTVVTYSSPNSTLQIVNADQYGGAGGTGRYLFGDSAHNGSTSGSGASYYRIQFTTTGGAARDMTYFGFWWSAVDQNSNTIQFLNDGVAVFTFNGNSMPGLLPSAYDGNPTSNFMGQNANEPYVFMNFFFTTTGGGPTVFDEIRITANGAHFESDNHTFMRQYANITGTPVPEPALVGALGVGLAGLVFWRWRRHSAVR